MRRHRKLKPKSGNYERTLDVGEIEECLVVFDYQEHEPDTGPSYSFGGDPGCPASVDITSVIYSPCDGVEYEILSILSKGTIEALQEDFLSQEIDQGE